MQPETETSTQSSYSSPTTNTPPPTEKKNTRTVPDPVPGMEALYKKEARTRIIRTTIKCFTVYMLAKLFIKK